MKNIDIITPSLIAGQINHNYWNYLGPAGSEVTVRKIFYFSSSEVVYYKVGPSHAQAQRCETKFIFLSEHIGQNIKGGGHTVAAFSCPSLILATTSQIDSFNWMDLYGFLLVKFLQI